MYNEQIEELIDAALADGVLTEKEKQVLFKKAQAQGIDLDEFEVVLDARLVQLQKAEKEKAEKSAPKSTKYGDVRKCPVCGALVPALSVACPECGYEFSGIEANLSSQKLSEMLLDVEKSIAKEKTEALKMIESSNRGMLNDLFDGGQQEKEKERKIAEKKYAKELISRKISVIQTFVVPSTKADLFEFLTALQLRFNDKDLGKAYKMKFHECTLKAQLLFPNDEMFTRVIQLGEETSKKIKFDFSVPWVKKVLAVILPPLAVINMGCGSVIVVTLLTMFGWIPGVIAAFVYLHKKNDNE